jgi:transposase
MDIMDETKSNRRPRRKFTAEFRTGAVRLVLKEGKRVAQVAHDLGLGQSVLHNWVRQAKVDAGHGPAGALTTEERAELARLRKENRELRMDREILKKAAAFFAKERA